MVPGSAGAEPPPGWYLRDERTGTLYKRGRLLGEVTEVTSGRPYAAKVIPRARLAAAAIGDRVERELELQRRLRHRHIVRLHGHFTDRGHLYLLLELCSRGSLADILRARGRLTEPEVRYYLRQLLSGLRYLHGHGLVHRDLKPSACGRGGPGGDPGVTRGWPRVTPFASLPPQGTLWDTLLPGPRGAGAQGTRGARGYLGTGLRRVHGADRPRPVRGSPPAGAVPAHPQRPVPAAPAALPRGPRPPGPHAAPRARGTARPGPAAAPPLPHPGFHAPHAATPRLPLGARLRGTGAPALDPARAALLWLCPCHPCGWQGPSPKDPSPNIRGGKPLLVLGTV
ncbi:basic proline-rich protein-like isoform X2 [Motacilla alba alba]|uniref:basic proline-rich protein-like isoform X2 n=1 Tax=Motacilla alba alba TaxID=1094192 RepID=UPI0018D4E20B|nr:basic proline-rich protein-like isoform X2 [Motacilla alba alba]